MNTDPRLKRDAANALQILQTSIHCSADALFSLQQHISHLEELLLAELGAKEFTRRLESLQDRDSDTLFIPEDHPRSRKRSSSKTEDGSSPKKARSETSASSLGLSSHLGKVIFDKAKSTQIESPTDISPKSSRKSSVAECSGGDGQQTTAQQMTLRSVYPRPQSRRGSQSVMLPNVQPSSNFHSRSSGPLTTKPSQDLLAAQRLQKRSSAMPMRKDSLHSDGESKDTSIGPTSSVHHAPAQHQTFVQSSSNHATPTLSREPAFPSTLPSSFSSARKPLSLVNRASPSSNKVSSSENNPSTSASKSSSFSISSSEESSSSVRKPWRASKKG